MNPKKLKNGEPESRDSLQKKDLPQLPQIGKEINEGRRLFGKGILAIMLGAALPFLKGCNKDLFRQHINLSNVKPLDEKGPIVNVESLNTENVMDIIQRDWESRKLFLDPRLTFNLPETIDETWEWAGDESYIKQLFEKNGYSFQNAVSMNGLPAYFFSDKAGSDFAIYLLDGLNGYCELVVSRWDQKSKAVELHLQTMPAEGILFTRMYEFRGEIDQTPYELYGFPSGTVEAGQGKMQVIIDGENIEIKSKDQFWEYLSLGHDAGFILYLILQAPKEFLKPQSEEDLKKIIQLLPSNDPVFFCTLVSRIIQYKKDTSMSQEYKAPMESINDGWADCDDYTILNGYWGKLNGFKMIRLTWSAAYGKEADHSNCLLENVKTGERFFCDNDLVYRGANVDKKFADYKGKYGNLDTEEI